MKAIDFNADWRVKQVGGGEEKVVTLPHDAMIEEERGAESGGGINTGWFLCHDYEYTKEFFVPEEYSDKIVTFEFEGVYKNAEVYLNGEKAAYRPYGYTNFYVEANKFLKFGEKNEIKVIAKNADQPNSRWYSGTGIYRPVTMFVSEKKHILFNGVKIRTLQINPTIIEVKVKTSCVGAVNLDIYYKGEKILSATENADGETPEAVFSLEIKDAKLWSPDTPELYTCKASFFDDEAEERFGIRTISCDSVSGFKINGERVIIRGACIHHDNGILGARCYAEAEERKIKILKDSGYNAVRSAHNPCSKAILKSCDELGVLMMDEYVDMWYVHKSMFDYASYIDEWWKQDLKDLVDKDYNHPSVIMYSTGNEVGETSEARGIALTKEFTEYLHSLDSERPVSCGINIWFNAMYSMGFGQYSDEKAKKAAEAKSDKEKKKNAVGSEFFNNLSGLVGADFMKLMATLPICDRVTRDAYANMDVAGYNYGIKRYKGDVKKYPERVILGSETFCSDAYTFWETAKKYPAVIGDFVWAGMDYLGEVGIGSWEYKEYVPDFSQGVGWISAGSGRVDLIGNQLGEALYTKVAFELTDLPQIAVVPVSHTKEKHSPSAWKFSNALPSWSWNGLDGKKAKVEVYSRAPIVELYINGKKVGKKKFKKNCRFDFTVKYEGGEITAVNLDKNGNELSRNSLHTAGEETVLSVVPEKKEVKSGEVCFVRLKYTDKNGVVKPLERGIINVEVEGGELLAVGSACPFNDPKYGYTGTKTDTYYGEAMAVVKATADKVVVKASDNKLSGEGVIIAK